MEPAAVLPSGRTRRSMQHGGMPGRIDSHHGFEHRRKFTGHEHHRRPADDGRFKLRKVRTGEGRRLSL